MIQAVGNVLLGRTGRLVTPPLEALLADSPYNNTFQSYSHYNYVQPGLIARLKRLRFEVALELAATLGDQGGVIDVGCADGFLLPSLASVAPCVVGIDIRPDMVATAQRLVSTLGLHNVRVVCSESRGLTALRAEFPAGIYRTAFVLETLEHVGEAGARLYPAKLEFLEEVFSLLAPGGTVIASVPVMVGPAFLVKYMSQAMLRLSHESYTIPSLLRSSLLGNNDDVEPGWCGGHRGFSHRKLERQLDGRFHIVARRSLGFSLIYALRRPNS